MAVLITLNAYRKITLVLAKIKHGDIPQGIKDAYKIGEPNVDHQNKKQSSGQLGGQRP